MIALAMSTHDKNLVASSIATGVAVEMLDVLLEALPLRLVAFAWVLGVCWVCTVQKTKIPVRLGCESVDK
jgi:hypothetical protein